MLVEDKLVEFLKRYHAEEEVRKVARLVNERFPDATGFLVPDSPSSVFFFKSEGSAYYCYPAKGTIHYSKRYSDVLNPKFCFNSWTREVDFSRPIKPGYLCYRKPTKKQEANDWKKKAKANKKARQENVDELLAATRDNAGRAFDRHSAPSSGGGSPSSANPYAIEPPEEPSEPKPVKIGSLDDVKKVNSERKEKPKKAKKRKKKKPKKHDATKGMW